METKDNIDMACEPAIRTYGMSANLRNSKILDEVQNLSREDRQCLIRYIYDADEGSLDKFEKLEDDQQPYTLEELNARIDEAEAEMDQGEGKTFDEMMDGFRKELLWLK